MTFVTILFYEQIISILDINNNCKMKNMDVVRVNAVVFERETAKLSKYINDFQLFLDDLIKVISIVFASNYFWTLINKNF